MTSDVFEANFGVPWMDVYDSLDVVRQGDLNSAQGGGAAIAGGKDCTNLWRARCICPQ